MDYSHIFNSDFLTATIIDVMSPMELYHYRNITKYTNTYITIDIIYDKIALCVQNRLKNSLGDKYDEFVGMIIRRNIVLYGSYVTEAIWNECLSDTYVDIRMLNKDMG